MTNSRLCAKMEDERVKQRNEYEICQRFVHLSCHKMVTARGSVNLRRNLLILHLLRKARKDMRQVPPECESLLQNDKWQPTPRPLNSCLSSMRRQSPSPIGRRGHRAASRSLTPHTQRTLLQRRINQQPSAPSVVAAAKPLLQPHIVYSADSDSDEQEDDETNERAVDEFEKENRSDEENVEELFLQKIGKSASFPESTEHRDSSLQKPKALSDVFTGQLQTARVHVALDEDEDSLPPLFFRAEVETPKSPQTQIAKSEDHVVPQQYPIGDFFASSPLTEEDETDGDSTEDEDDYESDGLGFRFPSFKRRLRKRKPVAAVGGVRPMVAVAEKRLKDELVEGTDGDRVLGEQRVPIAV